MVRGGRGLCSLARRTSVVESAAQSAASHEGAGRPLSSEQLGKRVLVRQFEGAVQSRAPGPSNIRGRTGALSPTSPVPAVPETGTHPPVTCAQSVFGQPPAHMGHQPQLIARGQRPIALDLEFPPGNPARKGTSEPVTFTRDRLPAMNAYSRTACSKRSLDLSRRIGLYGAR